MSSRTLPRARAVPLAYAYGLVALVGATVLAVSAYYLFHLAVAVKMPVQLAWTLPVALDLGGTFGTVCWMIAEDDGQARRFGRAFALSCLAATLAGNGLAHLLDFKVIAVDPWLAVGVCSVYPVILFAIVHLVLLLRGEQSAAALEAVEVAEDASLIDQRPALAPAADTSIELVLDVSGGTPAAVADASVEVSASAAREVSAPKVLRPRRGKSTVEQRYRWIHAQLDDGREGLTGGDIETHFGSRNGARELRRVLEMRAIATANDGEVA